MARTSQPISNGLPLLLVLLAVSGQQQLVASQFARTNIEVFDLLMPNISPDKVDTYYCTTIQMDSAIDYFIVGFVPNNTENSARQMLLYGCEEPGSLADTWDCGGMIDKKPKLNSAHPCRRGPQLLYAWSPNSPELQLPKGVGLHVGGRSRIRYITLQIQYSSTKRFASGHIKDNSGVFLQYTEQRQPKAAGVILLGTGGQIAPNSVENLETACKIQESKVIHPIAFSTHTHALGRVVSGYKVTKRAATPDEWELIGKQNPHVPQAFYPVPAAGNMTLTKGDILAARCTMVSDRTRITKAGMTAQDEMCNFYVYYWTEGPEALRMKNCFTPGAPRFYWNTANRLNNIPEDASSL